MNPFQVYVTFLALKSHFSKESYDYFKYNKKTRASLKSFYARRDRYWFEKISRQKNEKEIEEFFVANFVSSRDSESLWIGEIIKNGEGVYKGWQKKMQSLSYLIKQESNSLFANSKLNEIFDCSSGHPILLKKYLSGNISLETLVIYEKIFSYIKNFNKKLKDPVWETVRLKIQKYSPFINMDISPYRKIIKTIVLEKNVVL